VSSAIQTQFSNLIDGTTAFTSIDVNGGSVTGITDLAVADGGTGTSTGSITGTGALTFTAGGTDQNVTLTPSGTGYTLLNGNVGIGTTDPGAYKLNVNGGGLKVSGQITAGSDSNVITTAAGLVDGSKLDFATPKLVLQAEYPTAVLKADGTSNNGILTASNTGSTTWMNYYNWQSSQAALNDYDIIVRLTLPPDFASWQTNALVIDYCTQTIAAADNKLEVFLYVEGQSGDTLNATLSGASAKVSSVAATWTTATISATELTNALPAGTDWNSANTTAVLILRPSSMSSNYVRIGDVELNYNR
ncbi:MAG: hypothetical protein KKB30_17310, partial [Proteobacteria bacterium]|nr:hypothetical protein [Pseudomonadota bacterium]